MGRGPGSVTTHKRTVEAARKARSRRPAREERMEVITIMSPLRRPGHVSMEPGGFPAHTAMLRGCPWTQGSRPHPCSCPRLGSLIHRHLSISEGHLYPVAQTTHRSSLHPGLTF